jgi:hypothetical protein
MVSRRKKMYYIWDDHDYGIDNGEKDFDKKDDARDKYLNKMGEKHNKLDYRNEERYCAEEVGLCENKDRG